MVASAVKAIFFHPKNAGNVFGLPRLAQKKRMNWRKLQENGFGCFENTDE